MREVQRMSRFAADAITAERDAHIRSAIKANVPWTELAETYGLTVAEIMAITEKMSGLTSTKKGSALITTSAPPGQRPKDDGWD